MKILNSLEVVFFIFMLIGCGSLKFTRLVIIYTDNSERVTCSEIQPIISKNGTVEVENVFFLRNDSSKIDSCIWDGQVDNESERGKTYLVGIKYCDSSYDTAIILDTIKIYKNTDCYTFDIVLSNKGGEGIHCLKKFPIYSKTSFKWDTLYFDSMRWIL